MEATPVEQVAVEPFAVKTTGLVTIEPLAGLLTTTLAIDGIGVRKTRPKINLSEMSILFRLCFGSPRF
jgi:hypothetical protein